MLCSCPCILFVHPGRCITLRAAKNKALFKSFSKFQLSISEECGMRPTEIALEKTQQYLLFSL